jgi:isopentenyl phosphate kinase
MPKLYFVKMGGSVITETNVPNTAKEEEIKRILSEIEQLRRTKKANFVIGHGSGSFGHMAAKEYRTNEGIINDRSLVGAGITKLAANALNSIVIKVGTSMNIPVFPFSASSFGVSREKSIVAGFARNIKMALRKGFVPVVYGDVMIDTKQGVSIAPTEEIFRFLAPKLKPDCIVLGTDVDGVYDKDPTLNADAKLVAEIDSSNIDRIMKSTDGARKIDVTGGMRSKVALLHEIVKTNGCTGYITNIGRVGALSEIVSGNKNCTIVRP